MLLYAPAGQNNELQVHKTICLWQIIICRVSKESCLFYFIIFYWEFDGRSHEFKHRMLNI